MSLLDFGMGTVLDNFHISGIMLLLRAVLNMLARNASPRGPMCFRCLMFNLSKLLMTSAFSCPLWSSVYECQRVECTFTSPVKTECVDVLSGGDI